MEAGTDTQGQGGTEGGKHACTRARRSTWPPSDRGADSVCLVTAGSSRLKRLPTPALERSRGGAAQVSYTRPAPGGRPPLPRRRCGLAGAAATRESAVSPVRMLASCVGLPFFSFFPGGPGGCVLAVGWEVKPQRAAAAGL